MLDQLTRAATLTGRLPRTLEAMRGGQVSEYKARIIEAQTAELSAEDVAKADVLLAAAGQVKNPAGLRDFARRQVMRLDPAAERRKDRARQDAHVRLWQEDSGNAGLSAREMPAADAVIAWQNIESGPCTPPGPRAPPGSSRSRRRWTSCSVAPPPAGVRAQPRTTAGTRVRARTRTTRGSRARMRATAWARVRARTRSRARVAAGGAAGW